MFIYTHASTNMNDPEKRSSLSSAFLEYLSQRMTDAFDFLNSDSGQPETKACDTEKDGSTSLPELGNKELSNIGHPDKENTHSNVPISADKDTSFDCTNENIGPKCEKPEPSTDDKDKDCAEEIHSKQPQVQKPKVPLKEPKVFEAFQKIRESKSYAKTHTKEHEMTPDDDLSTRSSKEPSSESTTKSKTKTPSKEYEMTPETEKSTTSKTKKLFLSQRHESIESLGSPDCHINILYSEVKSMTVTVDVSKESPSDQGATLKPIKQNDSEEIVAQEGAQDIYDSNDEKPDFAETVAQEGAQDVPISDSNNEKLCITPNKPDQNLQLADRVVQDPNHAEKCGEDTTSQTNRDGKTTKPHSDSSAVPVIQITDTTREKDNFIKSNTQSLDRKGLRQYHQKDKSPKVSEHPGKHEHHSYLYTRKAKKSEQKDRGIPPRHRSPSVDQLGQQLERFSSNPVYQKTTSVDNINDTSTNYTGDDSMNRNRSISCNDVSPHVGKVDGMVLSVHKREGSVRYTKYAGHKQLCRLANKLTTQPTKSVSTSQLYEKQKEEYEDEPVKITIYKRFSRQRSVDPKSKSEADLRVHNDQKTGHKDESSATQDYLETKTSQEYAEDKPVVVKVYQPIQAESEPFVTSPIGKPTQLEKCNTMTASPTKVSPSKSEFPDISPPVDGNLYKHILRKNANACK